jgi:hypothetical protein
VCGSSYIYVSTYILPYILLLLFLRIWEKKRLLQLHLHKVHHHTSEMMMFLVSHSITEKVGCRWMLSILQSFALLVAHCNNVSAFIFRQPMCRSNVRLPSKRSARRFFNGEDYDNYEYYSYKEDGEDYIDSRFGFETGGSLRRYNDNEYFNYDDDELEFVEEEGMNFEDDDEENSVGNFWSNPTRRMDSSLESPRKQRGRVRSVSSRENSRYRLRTDSRDGANSKTRRLSRTSYRAGAPEAPPPLRDLYDRLFWYGFDPEDTGGVGDKTVFGGTKGKFNGLAYLNDAEKIQSRNGRGLPSPRSRPIADYYDDELILDDPVDEDGGPFDDLPISVDEESVRNRKLSKPPRDPPLPKSEYGAPPSRSRRRQRRSAEYNENGYVDGVKSWFIEDDLDDDSYDRDDIPRSAKTRERRRRNSSDSTKKWSPLDALDVFLGVNRQELRKKAGIYTENLGISYGRSKRSSSRRDDSGRPQRPGYAYPMIEPLGCDIEDDVVDTRSEEVNIHQKMHDRTPQNPQTTGVAIRTKTWEERAAAIARVPPAKVPAWAQAGPMLGVDARSQAISDALRDIQTAKQKLEQREKKESQVKEAISILKV